MPGCRRGNKKGLAGQLPGPPLKVRRDRQPGLAQGQFGRAIARPSIEGCLTLMSAKARASGLAGCLPGPPLKARHAPASSHRDTAVWLGVCPALH